MEAIVTPYGKLWTGEVRPVLCLDLDGTVRYSKSGPFINSVEDIVIYSGAEAQIWEYRDEGYMIVGVSNQGGVAHGFKTLEQAEHELDATIALFARCPFHIIKQCYHDGAGLVFPYNKRSLFRKPNVGMLAQIEVELFDAGYLADWDNSIFVGDRPEDEQCAKNAGIPFQWARDFFHREAS